MAVTQSLEAFPGPTKPLRTGKLHAARFGVVRRRDGMGAWTWSAVFCLEI